MIAGFSFYVLLIQLLPTKYSINQLVISYKERNPPSINSSAPIIKADSGVERYNAAAAISSGLPMRLIGIASLCLHIKMKITALT
jgi:hypothetical protein